jgi:hypothetical protein
MRGSRFCQITPYQGMQVTAFSLRQQLLGSFVTTYYIPGVDAATVENGFMPSKNLCHKLLGVVKGIDCGVLGKARRGRRGVIAPFPTQR